MNDLEEFVGLFLHFENGRYFITGMDDKDCLWMVAEWKDEIVVSKRF